MIIEGMELEQFIERNNITIEDWNKSKIEWDTLKEIGIDHLSKFEQRKETAELFARIIQRCSKVHSVRWRVKDPEHLMEKIVRKTTEGAETYNAAYLSIDSTNYHEIITDLVGVRALHLFKDDCFEIDEYLCQIWNTKETPVYYVRDGDEATTGLDRFEVKQHPAGYRSIHYVFESQPLNQKIYTEVQVRTIFEEGWSEIDHKVRYPNFSDNEQVSYFLRIFNRLAGSADEMGSFVKELVNELESTAQELEQIKQENVHIKKENDKNIAEIDRLFSELDSSKGQNRTQDKLVKDLKAQVEKLKAQSQKTAVIPSSRRSNARTTTTSTTANILKFLESLEDKNVEQKKHVRPKVVKKT
ncbi:MULTISPECIES: addiction module component [unclassified Pseudoalteromonas]|uniref:addiction module component n=1 Tax=unclassified Pseudoalteromonas TaxID=194690 RepID=UPI003014C31E